MRSLRLLLVGLTAMLMGGGAVWIYAQQRSAAGTLSPQDYIDIYQLYGYYVRDVDPDSERNPTWLFTEDGSFETPVGEVYRGKAELLKFYEGVTGRQTWGIRHPNSTFLIQPTPEGAKATSQMIGVEQRDASKPAMVAVFGVYHDTFVKTREGWRFKDRVFKFGRCPAKGIAGTSAPTSLNCKP